jgi:predicted metal-dependent HD superfamily phosphohydrolase
MLFELLQQQYAREHRVYHCIEHVLNVLDVVDALSSFAGDVDAVRLAAWFHDVVYDPAAADNEAQSAALAARVLPELGLEADRIAEVQRLILLTKDHHVQPGDGNGAVLVDADLAILGEERLVYQGYARAIRAEYAWVPEEEYRQGRLRVLRSFLDRSHIYHTPPMRQQREARARRNLAQEIDSLQK